MPSSSQHSLDSSRDRTIYPSDDTPQKGVEYEARKGTQSEPQSQKEESIRFQCRYQCGRTFSRMHHEKLHELSCRRRPSSTAGLEGSQTEHNPNQSAGSVISVSPGTSFPGKLLHSMGLSLFHRVVHISLFTRVHFYDFLVDNRIIVPP